MFYPEECAKKALNANTSWIYLRGLTKCKKFAMIDG